MNKQEYIKFVERWIESNQTELLGDPFDGWCRSLRDDQRDSYSREDLQEAIDYIKDLAEHEDEARPSSAKRKLDRPDHLANEVLIKEITPWVKDLRKRLFGKPGPPFDWAGAVKWIEEEARSNKRRVPKALLNARDRLEKKLLSYNVRLSWDPARLPFARQEDPSWRCSVPVCGPKLETLERETRLRAKDTGFLQAGLVLFVLAGKRPYVPRIRFSDLHVGQRREISLTFLLPPRDLDFSDSDRELQRLCGQMKPYLKLRQSAAFKKKQEKQERRDEKYARIYRLVKDLEISRGIRAPAKDEPGRRAWWIKALETWNKKYPKDAYEFWQGLMGAYERLTRDLPSS